MGGRPSGVRCLSWMCSAGREPAGGPDMVSPGTLALVRLYLEHRRAWGLLPESQRGQIGMLDAIQQRGEPDAAILLWPGIERRPAPVRHRALEIMGLLIGAAGPHEVLRLVWAASSGSPDWSQSDRERWRNLTPEDVRAVAADRPACAGLLVLLSGHPSGYVREAAVLGLEGLTMPWVLPALGERLNDWVDPVRRAAFRAMRGFLSAEHAAVLVGSLDLLDGLRRRRRADHQAVLDQIDMVLREPAARPSVQAGLASPNPVIRRGCYAALLHGADPDPWLAWGLESADPWIVLRAAVAIRALSPERVPAGWLDRMADCPHRPVRQLAVEMIGQQGDAARLRGFLVDCSPTLREFARYYLTRILGAFEAKEFYREVLAAASDLRRPWLLAGLGETGDGDDVPALLSHLAHPRPLTRLAALRALARLAPPALVDPFLAALADRSDRIRQVAAAALAARRSELPAGRLAAWAGSAGPAARRCVVHLLAGHPREVHLPLLLPFLVDADEQVRGAAETVCLRGLGWLLNPFLASDPWRAWIEQHGAAWSAAHRTRVQDLIRARIRGR